MFLFNIFLGKAQLRPLYYSYRHSVNVTHPFASLTSLL